MATIKGLTPVLGQNIFNFFRFKLEVPEDVQNFSILWTYFVDGKQINLLQYFKIVWQFKI